MIELHKDSIEVVDNLLPEDLYEEMMDDVRSFRFTYGWLQSHKDYHGHFNVELIRAAPSNVADVEDDLKQTESYYTSLHKIWKYVQSEYVGLDKKLIRCYFNGHVFGIDGYTHYDSRREDEWSMVIYTNFEDEWNPDWGGETSVFENGEIVKSVLPKKNRAIIFAGNKLHAPRPLGRFYTGMRQIIVFKFRSPRTKSFEKVSTLVKELGGMQVQSRCYGNMHDHLLSCYSELSRRGVEEEVCEAAGLHALYGSRTATKSFLHPKKDSSVIRDLFSYRVEELVYLCSILARPEGLVDPVEVRDDAVTVKLFNGDDISIPRKHYDDLMLIEAANQASLSIVLDRDKYPKLSSIYPALEDEKKKLSDVLAHREHFQKHNKYIEYNIRKKKKNE